jgi:hypothetical protein
MKKATKRSQCKIYVYVASDRDAVDLHGSTRIQSCVFRHRVLLLVAAYVHKIERWSTRSGVSWVLKIAMVKRKRLDGIDTTTDV